MNVTKKMAQGAVWMMAIRWCVRGLDVVMLIILARLLTSDDFGVFAAATLVVGFLEVLSQAGIDIALIRNQKASDEHFDAAWTIQVIQGVVVALLLLLAAPALAAIFNEPRLTTVMQLLALRPLIQAFTNIGTVNFLRDLDYSKEFQLGLYRKLPLFLATLGLAFVLESYMALVWGTLIGTAVGVLISYVLHAYRPRFSLARVKDIWAFSGFMLIYYAAEDLVEKLDRFVVGRIAASTVLGQYHVASQVVHLPLESLVTPLWRALVPGYSKLASDSDLLISTYLRVLGFTAALSFGVGFTTVAIADSAILGLLGERWAGAILYAQPLALVPAFAGIVDSAMMIVSVMGYSRLCARSSLLRLLVLLTVLPAAGLMLGVEAIAPAYLICSAALLPMAFVFLRLVVQIPVGAIVAQLWRPLLAGAAALFTTNSIGLDNSNPLLALAVNGLLSIVTYVALLLLLWFIAGRPEGAEATVLRMCSNNR
jgi:lipopolysaccharide exporter